MSGAHAFLPPSGAEAWAACAAWPTMNRLYPTDDTEESLEGTAAHDVFDLAFSGYPAQVGQVASNGVPFTEEMLEAGDLYVDTIDADLAAAGLGREWLHVERRVAIPQISPENWGTPDTWFYNLAAHELRLYDFKYGHLFVDAYRNWQCVDYAAGIVADLRAQMGAGQPTHAIRIVITVVQPRNFDGSGPVRRWETNEVDVQAQWAHLKLAAERALKPNPAATPGVQACQYCPGRHACTALQREGYRAKHLSLQSVPVEMPPSALAIEHAMLEDAERLLKARREGLAEQIQAMLKRGAPVPGYALEPTMSREGWALPAGDIVAAAGAMGVQIAKSGILTPKQAEKAGLHPDLVKAWTTRSQTGLKLVRDDGTRAAKVFGKSN